VPSRGNTWSATRVERASHGLPATSPGWHLFVSQAASGHAFSSWGCRGGGLEASLGSPSRMPGSANEEERGGCRPEAIHGVLPVSSEPPTGFRRPLRLASFRKSGSLRSRILELGLPWRWP
jgi:hypothetical protein